MIRILLDRYIFLVPIFMILASLLSNFIDLNYVLAGNLIGYSIAGNLAMFYFFNYKGRYCWFTRNAPIGLILVNFVDIIGVYISEKNYIFWFNVVICSTFTILALIFFIKKRLEHD